MNREIITKRVKGKGTTYLAKCPLSKNSNEMYVGNPKHCNSTCPFFAKRFEREGKAFIHCNTL